MNEQAKKAAFTAAIKAAMRLDPDVSLMGEVREPDGVSFTTARAKWVAVHSQPEMLRKRIEDALGDTPFQGRD